ncbi:MAG: GGDEF domain-containing protein [Candidatus Woesearchaeota archaeon]
MNESLEDFITIILKSGCEVSISGPDEARQILQGRQTIDYFRSSKDKQELDIKLVDYLADLAGWAMELEARCASLERKCTNLVQGAEEYDNLTGLYTRRCIGDVIGREVLKANRYNLPLSVVLLQVYGLDSLGERQGKSAIDNILRTTADIVRASTRGSDVASRYAEDKFAILLPFTEKPDGQTVARRIHLKLNSELYSEGITTITASTHTIQYEKGEDLSMFFDRIEKYVGVPQNPEMKLASGTEY